MPYFTSATTSRTSAQGTFISLQINACGFLDESDGSISPALFLWYNAPSSQLELTAQLKRDYMALAHIPSMVTVLANDGRVLHQNGEIGTSNRLSIGVVVCCLLIISNSSKLWFRCYWLGPQQGLHIC